MTLILFRDLLSNILMEGVKLFPKFDMEYNTALSIKAMSHMLKLDIYNPKDNSYHNNEQFYKLIYVAYSNPVINKDIELYYNVRLEQIEISYLKFPNYDIRVDTEMTNHYKHNSINLVLDIQHQQKLLNLEYSNVINAILNINSNATILSYKNIKEISKEYKYKHKQLIKLIKNKKSIDIEWDNLLEVNNLKFSAYLFMVLFFISGFTYTSLLTFYLDIEMSNFYTIYDYIESNISSLVGIIIYMAFFILYTLWTNSPLKENNSPKKNSRFYLAKEVLGIITFFVLYVVLDSLLFLSMFIFLGMILVLIYILNSIGKHKIVAYFCLLLFYVTCINMFVSLKVDSYKYRHASNYEVIFKNEYQEYSHLKFLFNNSNYIFLSDPNNIIIIMDKDTIIGIKQKDKASSLSKSIKNLTKDIFPSSHLP